MDANTIAILKGAVKSKTMWLNTLTLIVDYAGLLTGVIPPGTLTAVVALANMGIRLLTVESLKTKGQN
jgi:hypothetical protein